MHLDSGFRLTAQNTFWLNCGFWVIIIGFWCLILDICMLANKTMSLFVLNLVWFGFHVAGFKLECSSCSSFFFVWSVLSKKIVFMFFMLNLFWFWVFVFCLFSGSPKWVNQVRSKLGQTSKALFGLPLFLQ